jgi:XTP/dITP diphosphohydrolase
VNCWQSSAPRWTVEIGTALIMQHYVLASDNPGKLREMAEMFMPLGISVRAQGDCGVPPDVEETGGTFIENALIKARHAAQHSGLPAIADDSGLVVPALDGAPGIYSARYAGEPSDAQANIRKLLQALEGSEGEARDAYFFCAMVCLASSTDPAPLIATGAWHGRILHEPTGEGGFGYDPVFGLTTSGDPVPRRSSAELSAAHKNRLSHRGQALRKLVRLMHEPRAGAVA